MGHSFVLPQHAWKRWETRFPHREISTVSLDLQVWNLPIEYKRNAGLTKTDVRNWFAHAIQAARAVLLMSVSVKEHSDFQLWHKPCGFFFSNSASMPKPRITETPLINLNIIFGEKKVISVREVHDTVLKRMWLKDVTNSAAQADCSFNAAYDLSPQYNTTIFVTQQSPIE